MDSAQLLVTVLGAGGGGAALLAAINGFYKWLSGAAGRERDKNTDLVAQRKNAVRERDRAETERDEADRKRREAFEYSSMLRRQLIEAGIEPIPIPFSAPEVALPDDTDDLHAVAKQSPTINKTRYLGGQT